MLGSKLLYTQLFINNEFVNSKSGKTYPDINPANGEKIYDISEAESDDVDRAVAAAKKAFHRTSKWRTMSASERGSLLMKLVELIEKNLDELAKLESLDNGKVLPDSKFDIACAIDVFKYYAGWCDKIHGNTIPADGNVLCMTRKEPVGICGQIIPWNYPVLMLSWKWGPALAAGCTLILKPADQTPLTALALAALSKEAGFPDGVINVLPGQANTGAAIASHNEIDKIAFTGSTMIGKKVMRAAADSNMKRISLEMGGKSPLVVFDDANLDEAAEIASSAILTNHGQNCCAGSRTYVQDKIYDAFVKKSVELAKKKVIGDPFDEKTTQGPQIDERMMNRILEYIESAKKEGASLEFGGNRVGTKGYYVQPTVFSNVTENMTIAKEEIFGPVQSILRFKTLDEVIERANDSHYGLAAGCITKNIDTALTFAKHVQGGSIWINCYDYVVPQAPFGGFKQSGLGRELGEDSLNGYLEIKTITIKLP